MINFITTVKVYNDKKHIGDIKQVWGGFQYFLKGYKVGGTVHSTLESVKAEILAD